MPTDNPVPAAAITTSTTKGPAAEPAKTQPAQVDGTVKVRPIASYFCTTTEEHKGPASDAYSVDPSRAAELFANHLVDYDSDADLTKAIDARVRTETEASRAARKLR